MMQEKTNADLVTELHNIARHLENNDTSPYYRHIAGILRTAADELTQVDKSLWACSMINSIEDVRLDLNHFKLIKSYVNMKGGSING